MRSEGGKRGEWRGKERGRRYRVVVVVAEGVLASWRLRVRCVRGLGLVSLQQRPWSDLLPSPRWREQGLPASDITVCNGRDSPIATWRDAIDGLDPSRS